GLVQLAAVDGIGAGGTDVAGGDIDDLTFLAIRTDTDHTLGSRSGAGKRTIDTVQRCTGLGGRGTVGGGITQYHAVGLRGTHAVTDDKGVVLLDCVVVAQCRRVAPGQGRGCTGAALLANRVTGT